MPRVFSPEMLDEGALDNYEENFEDDEDPYLVPPSAFQYLPPPVFGGPEGEVRVPIRPEQAGTITYAPSMFERFAAQNPQLSAQQTEWAARRAAQNAQAEKTAALIASRLAELGAVRAYCRYDGGNDEGFAWLDHCVMKDGSTRARDEIAKDLKASEFNSVLPAFAHDRSIAEALDHRVANFWVSKVLGEGYGTGEYVMYGAISVDLETGIISDDVNPAPIVQNIELKSD